MSSQPAAPSYRRLGRLARAMVILLGISAAVQVILIPVLVALRSKSQDYLHGTITRDTYENALSTQRAVQGLQSAATVAVLVLTMIWMYRLAQNHRAFGRPNSTWAPGWAIGGWFVPPGLVYAVPWLMFRELWKGSDPANVPNDASWKRRPASPLLTIWWVLYGFVPILGAIGSGAFAIQFGGSASSLSDKEIHDLAKYHVDWFAAQLVVAIAAVASAVVYAKIVHDLTRRQQALTGEV